MQLVGEYSSVLMKSLETATTYLYIKAVDSDKSSQYHKGFLTLLELLRGVLANNTNALKTGPRSLIYRFLRRELLQVAAPTDLTIITFNYDLLIERILEEIDSRREDKVFLFPGCYRLDGVTSSIKVSKAPGFSIKSNSHDGVALLKLHGSMNWQSIHTSNTPTPSAMFNTNRKLFVMDCSRIPASLTWRREKRKSYLKPVIVPPVSGKRGMMHASLRDLWNKAGTALSEADRVVIAGYSCPPLDLEARILLSENMRANSDKRVYLINPDPSIVGRFVDMCGVGHITVYTSISNWVEDSRVS